MDESAPALLLDADAGKTQLDRQLHKSQRVSALNCHVTRPACRVRPAAQFLALDRVRAIPVAAGDNHGLAKRQAQVQQPVHELRHHQAFTRVAAAELGLFEIRGVLAPVQFSHRQLS